MKLNTPQRATLFITAIIIVGMVLFPPTCYKTYAGNESWVFSGYQFVGTMESNLNYTQIKSSVNPEERVFASVYHLEPVRLSFQLLGTLLIAGLVFMGFHNFKREEK